MVCAFLFKLTSLLATVAIITDLSYFSINTPNVVNLDLFGELGTPQGSVVRVTVLVLSAIGVFINAIELFCLRGRRRRPPLPSPQPLVASSTSAI